MLAWQLAFAILAASFFCGVFVLIRWATLLTRARRAKASVGGPDLIDTGIALALLFAWSVFSYFLIAHVLQPIPKFPLPFPTQTARWERATPVPRLSDSFDRFLIYPSSSAVEREARRSPCLRPRRRHRLTGRCS